MASSRLPGKVLAQVDGKPMLERMIERLKHAPSLSEIVIATTQNTSDDAVEELARRLKVGIWRGSEDDVLSRVLDAAQAHGADVIVELTGDCPLIDPAIVERVIDQYKALGADYVSNVLKRSYPIGMDTQVFATSILADVARRTSDPADREHVSLFIYRHPELYSLANVEADSFSHRPELRLTLDTAEDLEVIRKIFLALLPRGPSFSLHEILKFLDAHPATAAINAQVQHRHV